MKKFWELPLDEQIRVRKAINLRVRKIVADAEKRGISPNIMEIFDVRWPLNEEGCRFLADR